MQTERKTYRKICQHCGKEFIALTSVTAYCSHRCASLALKNKKRDEKEFGLTLSWFTSTIKRHQIKPRIIGNRNFYKKDMMEAIFTRTDYSDTEQWYTFHQLREMTGMRTESICDFCKSHKIQRERKNGITYVSKRQWDKAKGNGVDTSQYITMKEITQTYKLSRNHLYTIFKENGIDRVKIGNFVYFNREEVKNLLTNRE